MAAPTVNPLVALPGGWELVLIVLVIVLLFGAKKLPELARNTGRSLRIFKAETKGLMDDDDDEGKDAAGAEGSTTQGPRATPQLGTAAPHGDPLREELHQSDAMPGDRREGPSA